MKRVPLIVSEEARICLDCKRSKCSPNNCRRYKLMKEELKKTKKSGGTFKNEGIE